MHPILHTESTIENIGGSEDLHFSIHHWLDATKEHFADCRHRSLRHHALGVIKALSLFPTEYTEQICQAHIYEDCGGKIPTLADWASEMQVEDWMLPKSNQKDIEAILMNRWGGSAPDYKPAIMFLTEGYYEDPKLGFYLMHSQGLFELERELGVAIKLSDGNKVPTRYVGELIIVTALSTKKWIPSPGDWLKNMKIKLWMNWPKSRKSKSV